MTGEPLSTAALLKITIGAAVAGTGVAVYGQYQQGKNAQAQAKAQSAINLYNSKVAQREADAEAAAAKFESAQFAKKAKSLRKKQAAIIGASGGEVKGSPLLVQEDTAAELALEASNIRQGGQARVRARKQQSILDISAASAAKARASGFGKAAVTGAGATLLQGGAQTGFNVAMLRK